MILVLLVLVQALLADTFSAIAGVTSYGGSWRKDAVNQCLSFYLCIQILQGVHFVSATVSQTDREVSAGFTHFQWWKRNKKLMSLSRNFTSNRLWSWLVQIRNTLRHKKSHLSQLKLTQTLTYRMWSSILDQTDHKDNIAQRMWSSILDQTDHKATRHRQCGHLFWIKLTTKQRGTENVVIYFGSNWPQSNVAQRMWSSILEQTDHKDNVAQRILDQTYHKATWHREYGHLFWIVAQRMWSSILDQTDHKATWHRECGHLSWLKWTTKTVRHRAISDNKDSVAQRPKRTTKTVWHRGTRLPFRWGLFLLRRRTPFLQSLHSQGPLENTEWHKSS